MTFYPFLPQSEVELALTMLAIIIVGAAIVFVKLVNAARSGPPTPPPRK